MNEDRPFTRKEAAEYWSTHSIDETVGEEVEVETTTPIEHYFKIKVDREYLDKLVALAEANGESVTQTAQALIYRGLAQTISHAPEKREAKAAVAQPSS